MHVTMTVVGAVNLWW